MISAYKLLDKQLSEAELKYKDAQGYLRFHTKEENPRLYAAKKKMLEKWQRIYKKLLSAKYVHPIN